MAFVAVSSSTRTAGTYQVFARVPRAAPLYVVEGPDGTGRYGSQK